MRHTKVTKDIIRVFIKAVFVFHHIGISWLLQAKEQIELDVDETCAHWCKYVPCNNTTIYCNLHGPVFEYLFATARQDRNY